MQYSGCAKENNLLSFTEKKTRFLDSVNSKENKWQQLQGKGEYFHAGDIYETPDLLAGLMWIDELDVCFLLVGFKQMECVISNSEKKKN